MSNVTTVESVKFRKGTSYSATFPTLPSLTVEPRRVDFYEEQGSHSLLVLEYPSESPLWFQSVGTGVPVSFTWKQDTLTRTFVGYVSSISKVNAPQRMDFMQVTCVGATYPLKERVTRVFKNVTIPQAVGQIVSEYGFAFAGEEHPQVFPQLTIAGSSYWEWIQEQARRIGYAVVVDGMNFVFKPLDRIIDLGFSNAAVLSMGDQNVPFNTQFLDRTLDYFKVISGSNVEDSNEVRAVKTVGGVDPITAKPFVADKSPDETGVNLRTNVSDVLFTEYRTDRVVNDQSVATSAADGAAQLARFNIPARVKCQGDPRIRPYGSVFINGTGALTDGFWTVRKSHHMFHKVGDYIMELSIATDGLGTGRQNAFRTRGGSLVGTINLVSVVANSTTETIKLGAPEVKLTRTSQTIKEHEQGFLSNPAIWKAVE